jgi:anti-sigma regulatory factor (Ser/Thr protein kinase)
MSAPPAGHGINWVPLHSPTEMLSVPPYSASLTVANRPESVRPAVAFLVQTARALRIPEASKPLFEVALDEAVTNAVKHGNGGDEGAVIVCEIEMAARQLIFRIIDSGPGFVVPDPALPNIIPDQVQAIPESGFGLPIIQTVFPAVRAARVNGRFALELGLPVG